VNDTLNSLDSAVAGEAAGICIGLLLLGRLNEPIAETAVRVCPFGGTSLPRHVDGTWHRTSCAQITECLAYAHETKHEKVIRGISLGMAFIAYAQEEAADSLIAQVWGGRCCSALMVPPRLTIRVAALQMVGDTDAIIRYGGMYAIGMAYVGTSSNAAVRKLLHVAVSDVNDDVRRAAVSNLGFVLLRSQEQVRCRACRLRRRRRCFRSRSSRCV
jgi:26S proteasome regulatory subunit N2